jgi:hypothetical protein
VPMCRIFECPATGRLMASVCNSAAFGLLLCTYFWEEAVPPPVSIRAASWLVLFPPMDSGDRPIEGNRGNILLYFMKCSCLLYSRSSGCFSGLLL